MIAFGNRCSECGAVGVDAHRLSLWRFPMVAYKPGTGSILHLPGEEPKVYGGETPRKFKATLVRQLCSKCKPNPDKYRRGGVNNANGKRGAGQADLNGKSSRLLPI